HDAAANGQHFEAPFDAVPQRFVHGRRGARDGRSGQTDGEQHQHGAQPHQDSHHNSPCSPGRTRLNPASASDAVSTPAMSSSVPVGLATALPAATATRAVRSHSESPALSHSTSTTHPRARPFTTTPASRKNATTRRATGASVSAAAPINTPADTASSDRTTLRSRSRIGVGHSARVAASSRRRKAADGSHLGSPESSTRATRCWSSGVMTYSALRPVEGSGFSPPACGGELTSQVAPGSVEERLDRAQWHAEKVGDVLIFEAFLIAQDEYRAVVGANAIQGPIHRGR